MHIAKIYHESIDSVLRDILQETESLDSAADAIAKRVIAGRVVHVLGSGGHSIMGAEEIFSRAGGFACINAMLDPNLSYVNGSRRTTLTERTVGYAKTILEFYEVRSGDIMIIVNVNGINAVTIDSAMEAKARGVETVGVTSRRFSESVPEHAESRHPSKANLCDIADHTIDLHVPAGDAILDIEGVPTKVAASSTMAVAFALNALMARVAQIMVAAGVDPPIHRSGNLPGGIDYNATLKAKYWDRVKHYM